MRCSLLCGSDLWQSMPFMYPLHSYINPFNLISSIVYVKTLVKSGYIWTIILLSREKCIRKRLTGAKSVSRWVDVSVMDCTNNNPGSRPTRPIVRLGGLEGCVLSCTGSNRSPDIFEVPVERHGPSVHISPVRTLVSQGCYDLNHVDLNQWFKSWFKSAITKLKINYFDFFTFSVFFHNKTCHFSFNTTLQSQTTFLLVYLLLIHLKLLH
jgi:hypothetical protein